MELQEQNQNEEIEIDLLEVFHAIMHRWWLVAMSLVIGAGLAAGVTMLCITPQYEATSMIYILSKTTSISSAMDIQLGSQLTVDFATLATSRPVLEKVIEAVDLDTTVEELKQIITVDNPTQTQILKFTVENPDPVLAKNIANALADETASKIASVMVTDKPSTVEEAVVPDQPASPSLMKNTAIGGLLFLLLAMAVITIQVITDDTIKKEDDVQKYLGLNTLAAIPLDAQMAHGKKRRKKAV